MKIEIVFYRATVSAIIRELFFAQLTVTVAKIVFSDLAYAKNEKQFYTQLTRNGALT